MFLNKTKQIIELDKNDVKTVMEFCSHQIRANYQVQANVNQCVNAFGDRMPITRPLDYDDCLN